MNALVVLATGKDRPGIVEQVSGAIFQAGSNLEDSRMAILGGEFALIALVTGTGGALEAARRGLEVTAERLGLRLEVKPTSREPEGGGQPAAALAFRLEAVGMDHPGIVHRITSALAALGVNVCRLDSSRSPAPISGTPVFRVEMDVQVPAAVSLGELRRRIEAIASQENLDWSLRAGP